MKKLALGSVITIAAIWGLFFGRIPSALALTWNWDYAGNGITASGTFTTNDNPNDQGFYVISEITGKRNGETITGLQTAGTSIPGNEPFAVDNLIRPNPPQLTGDGFGYSTTKGNYSSPYFASFLPNPDYLEVLSAPPLTAGYENFGPEDSELPISFTATPITVP